MISSDQLSPIPGPTSLKQQAYEAIKEAILTLRFKPGDALVEADLAERLGVSKTPVRDALSDLEKEGLVVRVLHKGTYVSKITKRDICEIFELRAVLEGLAARLATANITAEDLDALQALLREQDESLARGDIAQASLCNRRFHAAIIKKAGRHRLLDILTHLEDHTQRFRVLSDHLHGRLNKSTGEHARVLDAFRQGDAEAAERAMRAHLHSVLDDLAQAYIPEIEQE